jgi:hypothetical protein
MYIIWKENYFLVFYINYWQLSQISPFFIASMLQADGSVGESVVVDFSTLVAARLRNK